MIEDKDFVWLNNDAYDFLRADDSYVKEGETVAERVEIMATRAFKELRPNEEYFNLFMEFMTKGFISLSSPTWANYGRKGQIAISCFGSYIDDSMESILYTSSEVGMMSKYGGGTSGKLNLRPRGSKISKGGKSDGTVHFCKLYDKIVDVCKQSSVRRGAMAVYLDLTHKDIDEFLSIKHEGSDIQNLFTGVCVENKWLSEMEDGDAEKRKLWAKVLQSRQRVGMPYVFFKDNVNENKPQIYKDRGLEVEASNLCVSPNTPILTSEGYQLIGDLENETVRVWNGEEWSTTQVLKTGSNQELLRVKTNSGYELDCTPYHKFYVQEGYKQGTGKNKLRIKEIRAVDLKQGDRLIKFDLPLIQGELVLKNAYVNGFYSGDGCLTKQGQRIYLYGEKRKLIDRFSIIENWTNQPKFERMYGHTDLLKDKYFVPDASYNIESRLNWLAGYLDADGSVCDNNGSQSIQVSSVEKEFLKEIQLMLQTLGCDSKVIFVREEGQYYLPKNDGSGEQGLYNCKETNKLLINGNSLFKLTQLGLKCDRLKWYFKKPNRECSQFIKIQSVEKLKDLSDTFCFTEHKRNMGMFGGILTGQCAEIMLPSNNFESFVCCLSSLNAELYDEWKDTKVVKVLTAFLDTVLDDFIESASSIPFLDRAVAFAKRHRALGIGVLGYHSYLQKNMIPFESMEAKLFNARLFKQIKEQTYEESIRLGEQFGFAPIFDEGETSDVKRRNATTMAVAPTSSSSFILGQTSQGIEPLRSNYYIRTMAKKKIPYKNPHLETLLESKGINNDETWNLISDNFGSVQKLPFLTEDEKKVFKTFSEISQVEVIRQASQRQKYIDQGQSINILVHPKTPTKDVNSIMMEAYKTGIKSLYYQHSISAVQEYSNNITEPECEACHA